MTDAFTEFLNENEQRSYPFVEDSSLVSIENETLGNGVILDFLSVHRLRYKSISLLAVVGPSSSGSIDFPAIEGKFAFYFFLHNDDDGLVQSFGVTKGFYPIDVIGQINDPNYDNIYCAKTRVTFGRGLEDIPEDAFWTFSGQEIEPSLIVSLYRNQIDLIKIIHEEGDDEIVGGDLRIFGGYNIDAQQTSSAIRLVPSLGAGTLGRFVGETVSGSMSKCEGALLSIGGQLPDEHGKFFIVGGKGIEVVNFPDEHKIKIKLEPLKIGETICADD